MRGVPVSDNCEKLGANTCEQGRVLAWHLLDTNPDISHKVNHNRALRTDSQGLARRMGLAPINWAVVYWTTEVLTGNGGSGFDPGEGA